MSDDEEYVDEDFDGGDGDGDTEGGEGGEGLFGGGDDDDGDDAEGEGLFARFKDRDEMEDVGEDVDYEDAEGEFKTTFKDTQRVGGRQYLEGPLGKLERRHITPRDRTLQEVRTVLNESNVFSKHVSKGKAAYQFIETKVKNVEDYNPAVLVAATFIFNESPMMKNFASGFAKYGAPAKVNAADTLRYFRILGRKEE